MNEYVWMEVKNWPQWERAVIEGPFMHHIGMIYGRFGNALREVPRFVDGLELVDLDG